MYFILNKAYKEACP